MPFGVDFAFARRITGRKERRKCRVSRQEIPHREPTGRARGVRLSPGKNSISG
jgi:hypothetical protein